MADFKVGDRVRLTLDRFRMFTGKQGVTDPNRIARIIKIDRNLNGTVWLDFPVSQGHDRTDLVKVVKPTIIIGA